MSKQVVVSVYDQVADTFFAPVCNPNTASAVRAFQQAVSEKDGLPNARDLVLYHIGFFDNVTGRLEPLVDEVQLIRGADCLLVAKEA